MSSKQQVVHVYTPQSAVRHPVQLAMAMFQDLWRSRGLAWRFFVRDLSARYRQSMLGYVWAFLPPLAATFTFVLLNRSGIIAPGEMSLPYPAFVLVGTVLWHTFADAVTSPIKTLTAARSMLAKVNFPREALLLSGLLDVLFNFFIRALLVVPVFLYYGVVPAASAPLVIAGVIALIALGFTIGLLLAPAALLYTDIAQGLGLVLSFWMLVTPVVYTVPRHGLLAVLAAVNPVSPLIVTAREWLTVGVASQLQPALWVGCGTVLLLFAGWTLYRVTMPILIERMGG